MNGPAIPSSVSQAVRTLLAETAGLDPQAITDGWLRSLIGRRLRERCVDGEAWASALSDDAAECRAVIEDSLVHESWFFRDVVVFDHLSTLAGGWRARTAAEPARVLCVPCAGGEEAWSIAATLVCAGVPPEAIVVDARDLSRRILQTARTGLYARKSLRNHHADKLARFIEPAPDDRFRIGPTLRPFVHFAPGNLLDLGGGRPYDVIFCRNALMYMHADARRRVLERLSALLLPDAPLFVGHAEMGMVMSHGFEPAGPGRAFCLRRRSAATHPAETAPSAPCAQQVLRARPRRPPPRPAPPPVVEDPAALLAQARRLADGGALNDALPPLLRCLKAEPMNAAAHGLAGIILGALGERSAAIGHLRKALYLDPADQASRIHLENLTGSRR